MERAAFVSAIKNCCPEGDGAADDKTLVSTGSVHYRFGVVAYTTNSVSGFSVVLITELFW